MQASTTTKRPLADWILNPNRFETTPKLSSYCAVGRHIVPVPEMLIVLVPLVLSEFTVTVPLYVVSATGENVTVTLVELPAAMLPLQAPVNPLG